MKNKNKKDDFTQTAEDLLSAEKSDAIKIDHLAFAFPISALRYCRKAGFASFQTEIVDIKKSFFTKENIPLVKRSKSLGIYPKHPVIKSFDASNLEEYEAYQNKVAEVMADFYEKTLKIWVSNTLGFELSPMRGRGLHGYRDSMTLRSNGVDVGFIGLGGQGNTVYFQISGTGCKSLFSHTTPFVMHHWLSKVFSITKLSRIDLAFDDFDGNFDCDYAERAYKDGWFRTANRGPSPAINPNNKYTYDTDLNKVHTQEMVCVGSRKSLIYWRIYNKKLEQGIKQTDLSWYRSEAELKKWSVDSLLNVAATFAGLCPFAGSVDLDKGVRTKAMSKAKEICLDVASRVRHVRRSAGKALGDVLEAFEGDISKTIGLILPSETGGKLGIPPIYQQLINQVTGVQHV